jgi:predicted Zn-dependent protease
MKARFLTLLFPLLPLSAHPDPSHTLEHLEEHLAETPDDPALLRQKADLLLSTGHPALARPVVDRLLAKGKDRPEDLLLEARTLHAEKNPAAPAKATALVTAHPRFVPGWLFLARLEDGQGHRDAAIDAMRRALDLSPKPSPSDVLACAAWLAERGDRTDAVAVIDQGLAKLGVLAGLHQQAIVLEVELGRPDAALRRLDALAARFRPSVELSLQRADILEMAGRFKEAAAACDTALALLEASPAARKGGDAHRERVAAIARRKTGLLAR